MAVSTAHTFAKADDPEKMLNERRVNHTSSVAEHRASRGIRLTVTLTLP